MCGRIAARVFSGRCMPARCPTMPTPTNCRRISGRVAPGIPVIDRAVAELYACGYLHNHVRMWLASYVVHLRKVHWRAGADWLYAHLLDGDLASNHLSWQWIAGTASHKPYLFNADNVARFAPGRWHSPGTAIDRSYEALDAGGAKRADHPRGGRRQGAHATERATAAGSATSARWALPRPMPATVRAATCGCCIPGRCANPRRTCRRRHGSSRWPCRMACRSTLVGGALALRRHAAGSAGRDTLVRNDRRHARGARRRAQRACRGRSRISAPNCGNCIRTSRCGRCRACSPR